MKRKKLFRLVIIVVLCLVTMPNHAFAHSTSQKGILAEEYIALQTTYDGSTAYGASYVGGETIGWSINEERHLKNDGLTVVYKLAANDIYLTEDILGLVEDGAKLWNFIATFTRDDTIDASSYSADTPMGSVIGSSRSNSSPLENCTYGTTNNLCLICGADMFSPLSLQSRTIGE